MSVTSTPGEVEWPSLQTATDVYIDICINPSFYTNGGYTIEHYRAM
jgi:hypothetical protein